jgi:hypothetical protein
VSARVEDEFVQAIDRIVFGDRVGRLRDLRRPEVREMVQIASRLNQELVPAAAGDDFRTRLRAHLMTTPVERRESALDRISSRLRWPDWDRSQWVALGAAAGVAAFAIGVAYARQRVGLGDPEL